MSNYSNLNLKDQTNNLPCWISMINEIHEILGFSWARIASRIGSSPSSVQKLVKDTSRTPRDKMFFNLACYYYKLFYSQAAFPKAKRYVEEAKDQTLCNVVIELLNRGLLDDIENLPEEQENKKKYLAFAQKKGFLGKEQMEIGISKENKLVMPTYHNYFYQ
jgi:hypothetical protein